jgi:hypothetical protein
MCQNEKVRANEICNIVLIAEIKSDFLNYDFEELVGAEIETSGGTLSMEKVDTVCCKKKKITVASLDQLV